MILARIAFFLSALFFLNDVQAQDSLPSKFIFYPKAPKGFNSSLGMIFTTTHPDVTEEIQFRIPAIDFHVLQKLSKNFSLCARLNSQILQNHLSVGLRWSVPINTRVSFSVGDDIGYWAGFLKREGFNTKAWGWMNYPNISAGIHFGKDVLVTLNAEAILNLSYRSYVGDVEVISDQKFFNGEALSLILEQPFYQKTWFIVGFRAMYVNDFWQTWALFETLDRNIFYPQMIAAFIL